MNNTPSDVHQWHSQEGSPTITRVSWKMGTEQEEKDGRWGNLWEAKATKSYSRGPDPKAEDLHKVAQECWDGPWGHFPACVPLPASSHHRRDHEILILSDLGPPRQNHVTWYLNNHNSGNTVWLGRKNLCPSPKGLMQQEGTGSRTQKSSMRPPWTPQGSLRAWHRQASTTSQPFLITTNVSCSSVYGVTPELIKCESLIVLAISHHILLICIILVSIFTNVTWKAVMWLLF